MLTVPSSLSVLLLTALGIVVCSAPMLAAAESVPAYRAAYELTYIPDIVAGTTLTVPIGVTNTGTVGWAANGGIKLTYHWYQGDTPISVGGLRTPLPQSLVPGQNITLDAQIQAPPMPGSFTLKWDMVREGDGWFSSQGIATGNQLVNVTASPADAVTTPSTVAMTGAPYGAVYTTSPVTMKTGENATSRIRVTNTGTLTWSESTKFHLSYHWYQGDKLIEFNGARTFLPFGKIASGQSVLIDANVKAPSVPGTYTLKWDMVQENIAWFSWKGVPTGDQVVTVK